MITMFSRLATLLILSSLALTGARADGGWKLEPDTTEPSYAFVEPTTTNTNIDVVVLACEQGQASRIFQLQLYLTDEGPLTPKLPVARPLKDNPQATITIDGRHFPVGLSFADDHVVVADSQSGPYPRLSEGLVAAMQAGKSMVLGFDLLAERRDEKPVFDSEAIVDLQAGGRAAIAAVRRCVNSAPDHSLSASLASR